MAFRATLEEVLAADLVVHVRDIAHPDSEPQKNDVLGVLKELGVADDRMERMLEVCNKIDLLPDEDRAAWENDAARKEKRFAVSAVTGQGVESLRVAIEEAISEGAGLYAALLGPADAAAAAWLHARGAVMSEDAVEEQTRMTLRLDDADIGRFATRFPSVSLEQL